MDDRLQELVQANVVATHAHQVLLARRSGAALDAYRADGFSQADLQRLVDHQHRLLSEDPNAISDWLRNRPSAFNSGKDLATLINAKLPFADGLPVNVIRRQLARRFGLEEAELAGTASLFQMNLEVDRDGDEMQSLLDFYVAVGLPLHLHKLGTNDRECQGALLELGTAASKETVTSPFSTDPAAWQISGMKLIHWLGKKLRTRDHHTLAGELLKHPCVQELLPQVRQLPEQRIAIVGHSYTMMIQWSTPAPFTWIAKAILEGTNPGIEILHLGQGGMTPGTADRLFRQIVLEYRPTQVFLFLLIPTARDVADLARLVRAFEDAGIICTAFTHRLVSDFSNVAQLQDVAARTELHILDIEQRLEKSPDRSDFVSLDGVHMTEVYHRLAAVELLKALVESTPSCQGQAVNHE